MIKLDSIKLKVAGDVIAGYNGNAFDTVVRNSNAEGIIYSKAILSLACKKAFTGLKNIELNYEVTGKQDLNNIIIECSSKLLKGNYYSLINSNTIEQVIDSLNSYNLISLDKNKFLDSAEILRCDVTENLKVSKPVSSYISLLRTCNLNYKYRQENYANEAIIFKKNVTSFKERFIMYDKFNEMALARHRQEAEILNIGNHRNVLRCENNIVSKDRLRKNCGLEGNVIYLQDVLNCKLPVNYNTFTEITEADNQLLLELYDPEIKSWKLSKKIDHFGMKHIAAGFDNDLKKIKEYLKTVVKNRNYNYYLNRFKDTIIRQNSLLKQELEAITEIKELLKVA